MTESVVEQKFVVHRDFGIPRRVRAFKGESKYPVSTLKVSDAIVGPEKVIRGAAVAARSFCKKHPGAGHRFSMYKLANGDYALVRIK